MKLFLNKNGEFVSPFFLLEDGSRIILFKDILPSVFTTWKLFTIIVDVLVLGKCKLIEE